MDKLFMCFVSKHVSRPFSISGSFGVNEGRLLRRNSFRSREKSSWGEREDQKVRRDVRGEVDDQNK